jgi:hypothetical protein
MTTMAKTKAKAKYTELKPQFKPMEVARQAAPAACDEGMPPEPMNQRKSNRFCLNIPITTLIVWAINQAEIVVIKILFL